MSFVDQFIYDFVLFLHLIVLMFGVVFLTGKLTSFIINGVFNLDKNNFKKR